MRLTIILNTSPIPETVNCEGPPVHTGAELRHMHAHTRTHTTHNTHTHTHTCRPAMRAWMAFLLFCHGDTAVAAAVELERTILARHVRKGLRSCSVQLHKSLMSPERRALKTLGLGGSIRTPDVWVARPV